MAYDFNELEGFWRGAGGPAQVAPTMAAIALAESSGENVKQKGEPYNLTGWGLWQITPGDSEPQAGIDQQLLDPHRNAEAAVAKFRSEGLGAWTTYTSGAYRRYLPAGGKQGRTRASSRPSSSSSSGGGGGVTGDLNTALGFAGHALDDVLGLISGPLDFLKMMVWLVNPLTWLRGVEVLFGALMLLGAVLIAVGAEKELGAAAAVASRIPVA